MRTLITIVGLASLVAVSGCAREESAAPPGDAAVATSGTDAGAVEQEIVKLEHEWVAAIQAKDTATIDRLLADDFVGTTNNRRYIKRDAIEDVREGEHETLVLDDVQVRLYGDTAIVDIDQVEKSRHGEDDFSGTYLFTNTWVKQGGSWKAVASHGSRVR